jgi:hypothetical protein
MVELAAVKLVIDGAAVVVAPPPPVGTPVGTAAPPPPPPHPASEDINMITATCDIALTVKPFARITTPFTKVFSSQTILIIFPLSSLFILGQSLAQMSAWYFR